MDVRRVGDSGRLGVVDGLVVHRGVDDVELAVHVFPRLVGAVQAHGLLHLVLFVLFVAESLRGTWRGFVVLGVGVVDDQGLVFLVRLIVDDIKFVDIDHFGLLLVLLVLGVGHNGEEK